MYAVHRLANMALMLHRRGETVKANLLWNEAKRLYKSEWLAQRPNYS